MRCPSPVSLSSQASWPPSQCPLWDGDTVRQADRASPAETSGSSEVQLLDGWRRNYTRLILSYIITYTYR